MTEIGSKKTTILCSQGDKPHILMLCTNSNLAGAPVHVFTLISQQMDRFSFTAVFGEDGPIANRLRDLGVKVEIISGMRSSISPIRDLKSVIKLLNILNEENPCLVHAHSTKAGMVARLASLVARVPVIYTVHGWGWRGMSKSKHRLIIAVEKLLYRLSKNTFIYVSKSVEQEGLQILGIPQTAGTVIHNGVPDLGESPFLDSGPIKILMVARVDRSKDHDTLLQAFANISEGYELWLCGEGTDSARFKEQIKKFLIPHKQEKIRLLGEVSDISDLLAQVDIIALISNFEALPLSIIEGMACGKPVIASDIGGIPELVIHGENGYLVPERNYIALAKFLERIQDTEIRRGMSIKSRKMYKADFQVAKMTTQIRSLYIKEIKAGAD